MEKGQFNDPRIIYFVYLELPVGGYRYSIRINSDTSQEEILVKKGYTSSYVHVYEQDNPLGDAILEQWHHFQRAVATVIKHHSGE